MEPGYGTAVAIGERGTASGDQSTATMVASVEPLAARVNGEPIFEHEYERAVLRYEVALQALGLDSADHGDYRLSVLVHAIDRLLIAQAAHARGLDLDLHELQNAFDESVQARGGRTGFDEWLQANDYSEAEFKQELQAQLLAGKVQAEVLSTVGNAAEQVHARHVLVTTREQAEAIKAQLVSGADFATIALAHSLDRSTRVNGGDLGWFPRGLLTTPEIETAAFELMPGERSGIVETSLGFHLVETLERDAQRALSPESALAVREAAVESWLSELRAAADIERFVP
jgi:parvulin-like peptidyl-prolyl isomerase